jgi:hypothetical protein
MNSIRFFRLTILILVVFVNAYCKKESIPSNPKNTPPKANAGSDIQVILPANSYVLVGSALDDENNIQKALWSKISGPSSFVIENPNSFSTAIKNLEQGVYQFELTVSDVPGLMDKDTVSVTVSQISTTPGEILFRNFSWGTEGLNGTLLWGRAIIIHTIYQYVPAGSNFRTFIKKGNAANWEELFINSQSSYGFLIVNGTLIIYSGYEETEPVDIKLVY